VHLNESAISQDVLEAMELMDAFNAVVHLPNVEVQYKLLFIYQPVRALIIHSPYPQSGEEVSRILEELSVFEAQDLFLIAKQFSGTVPIKKLLMVAAMAQQVCFPPINLSYLFFLMLTAC